MPTIDLGRVRGTDGVGVPTGGNTGQILVKASNANHDTKWVDIPKVEVDSTLKVSGKAADAKATGDALGQLSQQMVNYRTAVNLLHNSDFQNLVNQRGRTVYDSYGYTIDRWKFDTGIGNGIQITESGVVFKQTDSLIVFVQPIEEQERERLIGKMVTVVAELTDGSIGVSRAIVPASSGSVDSPQVPIGNSDLKINIYSAANYELQIRLLTDHLSSDVTVAHVAVYEGEYTAETLPPYRPKGYAVELAECQRWYKKGRASVATNQSGYATVFLPTTMRTIPNITVSEGTANYVSEDAFVLVASADNVIDLSYEAIAEL